MTDFSTNVNRRSFIAGTLAAGMVAPAFGRLIITAAVAPESGGGAPDLASGKRDTSEVIADFACNLTYDDLSAKAIHLAKVGVLDTLACMLGALGEEDISIVRKTIASSKNGPCTLAGSDLRASGPDAAMLNTGMARNLDYMNSYSGPYGGGHPSNSIGPILACSEIIGGSGKDILLSLVVATEVLGAFADIVNSRERSGVEHLGYVGIAMTAGAGKALRLTPKQMKNAVSLTAASYNPLQVTRAEQITMWKGFAAGYAALIAVNSALLAMNGMVGPSNTFDGRKGWKEVVAREQFDLQLTQGKRIHDVKFKLYLAQSYSLSAAEGIIELSERHRIDPQEVKAINVRSFTNAVSRLGFNGSRDPYDVTTKPVADHSFPYIVAIGLIDRAVGKEQYTPERINSPDVQSLLRKVHVEVDESFDQRYHGGSGPMPVAIEVKMQDGTNYKIEKDYFRGHPNKPLSRDQMIGKLNYLAGPYVAEDKLKRIESTVENLDQYRAEDLTRLLASPHKGSSPG